MREGIDSAVASQNSDAVAEETAVLDTVMSAV
jgi:hypothetical protein